MVRRGSRWAVLGIAACTSSVAPPLPPGGKVSDDSTAPADARENEAPTASSRTEDGGYPDAQAGRAEPMPEATLRSPDLDARSSVPPPDASVRPPPEPGDAVAPMRVEAGAVAARPDYNFAPTTRNVVPLKATYHGGAVAGDAGALSARLRGVNSGMTFDFGREVAGIASLRFGASDAAQRVTLSFAESSQYVGPTSDQSIGPTTLLDGALSANVVPLGRYTMPANKLRGGFRYLSVYLATAGSVELTDVSLEFTAAPTMPVPNQYPNAFDCNDDLLNRIWYAGAYTVQVNTIDPRQGRIFPYPAAGTNWDNSATVGIGNSVLVDGAKRDRTVWPGDLGIAMPTAFVSTGDLATMRNTLDTLFAGQEPATGEFPRSGPPLNRQNGHTTSDTYHLWTLIGASNYYRYSGDKAWLDRNWPAYKKALAFSTAKIASNGLFEVTLVTDWGRIGQGGANIAANALIYQVLIASAEMATVEGDAPLAASCRARAAALKTAANALLWDAAAGAFRDNLTSSLYPQDGNSLAVWYGLVDSSAKALRITAALRKNWNARGAHTPEADPARATISPFPGSMEVSARFVAGDDQGALDLIRLEWGYMLDAPIGTGSTFWEGYLDDGSFGYGGSYMSAAHGWSTGPTFALTEWVLGIAPDSASGKTFHVIPHPGDLTHVEGTLAMAPGNVRVAYDHPACGDFALRIDSSTHTGSVAVVGIPKLGATRVIQLNGVTVWDGAKFVPTPSATSADEDTSYVYVRGVQPGKAEFAWSPTRCR